MREFGHELPPEKKVPQINKSWEIPDRTESTLTDQLLKNRGIVSKEKFFNSSYERDSYDPFLLPDMEVAVDRIVKSFSDKQEIVAIFGDYDADGIPGSALLYKLFVANGKEPVVYIPDRESEGYGLNKKAIEHLAKEQIKLIITVDLGITGKEEVEFAKTLGIDVIITDHHEPKENEYPDNALAVVHPRVNNSKYPFGQLAGGGVAWKLAQAISSRTGKPTSNELKWLLELPAISTICDIVSLKDENRMIAKYGLKVLAQTRNKGLRALYRAGGIDTNKIDEYCVGFQIGPRLNAPGRMDHAALSFKLLTTDSEQIASEIASKIEVYNQDRRIQMENIQKQALLKIEEKSLWQKKVIVVTGEDWPLGLVGLAAGRLMEEFNRVVFLLGKKDGYYQGSGRSIQGFHLVEAMTQVEDLLESFGGHAKAAGLKIKEENLNDFELRIESLANILLKEADLEKKIKADAILGPEEITKDLIKSIEEFAPYGEDNPRPKFVIKNLTCDAIKKLGAEGNHLKLKFKENNLEAIGFGMGGRASEISLGKKIDALGYVELNVWTSNTGTVKETIQITLKDFKISN